MRLCDAAPLGAGAGRIALCVATLLAIASTPAMSDDVLVGLITKTEGNPFFVKMREGAQEKASDLGLTLQTYAGK